MMRLHPGQNKSQRPKRRTHYCVSLHRCFLEGRPSKTPSTYIGWPPGLRCGTVAGGGRQRGSQHCI